MPEGLATLSKIDSRTSLAHDFKPGRVEIIAEKPPTNFLMRIITRYISQTSRINIYNDVYPLRVIFFWAFICIEHLVDSIITKEHYVKYFF